MNLQEALNLANGKSICRKDWNNKRITAFNGYMVLEGDEPGYFDDGLFNFTIKDLLANDWMLWTKDCATPGYIAYVTYRKLKGDGGKIDMEQWDDLRTHDRLIWENMAKEVLSNNYSSPPPSTDEITNHVVTKKIDSRDVF